MDGFTLTNILMTLYLVGIIVGLFIIFKTVLNHKIEKKKTEIANNSQCKKVLRDHWWKLHTDYFWSNHMRFAWIMLFLLFFIAFGFAIGAIIPVIISFILIVITLYFLYFSIKSYQAFPDKAAQQLKDFETQIETAVKGEICFDADNIQQFSSKDDAFSTEPEIFSFPTNVTKIHFPPYESRVPKQPIIATRKLEFLILSREYFSICKSAATFNLLDPKRAGPPKKCAELPGTAGECQEYYYSQIRNVFYDDDDQSIHIIYNHDKLKDIRFPCKKMAPNRKPAMKALKGKLRLTERQKLRKIDEHDKYEAIVNRREEPTEDKSSKEDE